MTTPKIRIIKAVEMGWHPHIDERLIDRNPDVRTEWELAALELDRCGVMRLPTETEKFYELCAARPGHGDNHWAPYPGEIITLPRGETGRAL